MVLQELQLTNFRNYTKTLIQFNSGINILFGKNGQGKTNLLESIYYLALTKSFRTGNDRTLVRTNAEFFRIQGEFRTIQGRLWQSAIAYSPAQGKRLVVNGEKIQKFSEYIGSLPVVILAPSDLEITQAGPARRRKFLDIMLSQSARLYLHHLVEYRRALKQRNLLLQAGNPDDRLLDSWDEALIGNGVVLMEKRLQAVRALDEMVKLHYRELSGTDDRVKMIYRSSVELNKEPSPEQIFREALRRNRTKDAVLGVTTVGPHRDDLLFLINGKPLRSVGSQGEHKTFVIALKMAELEYLRKMHAETPVLLFDDIFGELDEGRISNMIGSLASLGQVFVTTTSPDFFGKAGAWTADTHFYRIEQGQIEERVLS